MNIIYLIGNGFDINLGMKTRYSEFYKYYSSIESPSQLIQSLKNEIDGNIENWSDLELALGKYTNRLKTTEEFNEVFDDIEDNLAEYLESIEKNFDYSKINIKKLYNYLVFPENSLPFADKNKILDFKRNWRNTQEDIYIITFNYTKTLETLIGYKGEKIALNEHFKHSRIPINIQRLEHVHGYHYDRMVMGVNDISQISNPIFHNNSDVIETLIKKDCNQAQKHGVDEWCKNQIRNAQLICVFGSSIGDTDNIWWELIGEQLKRDCNLIIFEKCDPIPARRPQKGKIAERKKKQYFLDKTKLNTKEKELVSNKIFIGINTNMFSLT